VDVIATTISGSIQDWGKVKRIVPLFCEHGMENVTLHSVDSHQNAREKTRAVLEDGGRIVISAGGSGTFNSVLEGCFDSPVPLEDVLLGFLRKGSADLLGKVLGMPDEIESAVSTFVESITNDRNIPCDVILARSGNPDEKPRHFVGYGGAEIFGRIPHYTENRFVKYYKGVLSQVFGDLGPFTTGMALALVEKILKRAWTRKRSWKIFCDGELASEGVFQALIIVNGHLGKDLPYSSEPLGSGSIYLFAMRDIGLFKLFAQARHAKDGSIMDDPDRWGMESFASSELLELEPTGDAPFPINVDGATTICHERASFSVVDKVRLISRD
jgi:diacylglycerol kinase family enzyme